MLVFHDVEAVRHHGLDRRFGGVRLELLTVVAEPAANGSTDVTLLFAGDAAVRLRVRRIQRHARGFRRAVAGAGAAGARSRRDPAGRQLALPQRLDDRAEGFQAAFARLVGQKRAEQVDVRAEVAAIIARVAADGDAAVLDYTRRFDRHDPGPAGLRVAADEIARAVADCPAGLRAALELAQARIEAFHRRQLPADLEFTDPLGGAPGAALAAAGCGRDLRPGRDRRLSELGADERDPGQDRGRRPDRDVRPDAGLA